MIIFVNASSNSDLLRLSKSIEKYGAVSYAYIRKYNNPALIHGKANKPSLIQILRTPLILWFLAKKRFTHSTIVFETSHAEHLSFIIISKLLKYKIIHLIHDPEPHPGENSGKVAIYNNFINKVIKNFIYFSPNKNNTNAPVVKLGGYEYGRGEMNRLKKKKVVLIGRLEPYKGIDKFIDFAYETQSIDNTIEFVIAGKGNIKKYLRPIMPQNITIINRLLSDAEFDEILSETKIVCLPYSSTTQSGVMIDAWRLGCFTIATELEAFKFYHDDSTSMLIQGTDSKTWARELVRLSNSDLQSEKISEYYYANHSSKKFAECLFHEISKF